MKIVTFLLVKPAPLDDMVLYFIKNGVPTDAIVTTLHTSDGIRYKAYWEDEWTTRHIILDEYDPGQLTMLFMYSREMGFV